MEKSSSGHGGQPPPAPRASPRRYALVRAWCRDGAELLFPSACLHCGIRLGAHRDVRLCPACAAMLRPIGDRCCSRCGLPLDTAVAAGHHCGDCLRGLFIFQRARALFEYGEPVAGLILQLKFSGERAVLSTLGRLAEEAGIRERLDPPDLVLPVPLHPARLRRRGFNQALVIARAVFPQWRDQLKAELLIRQRPTIAQSRLNGQARRHNLGGAFAVTAPNLVRNAKILLVDDVLTTGTTVNECTRCLLAAGAASVEVFTLARAK